MPAWIDWKNSHCSVLWRKQTGFWRKEGSIIQEKTESEEIPSAMWQETTAANSGQIKLSCCMSAKMPLKVELSQERWSMRAISAS